jgi:hypothetical protein
MKPSMTRLCFALLGLVLAALALPGCTDAEKCVRGEPGCACKTNGSCETGATCNTERMCIARTGRVPDEDSGTPPPPPPIDVECVDDDFATACDAFCEVYCAVQERMCVESRCIADECGPAACREGCGEDTECIMQGCELLKTIECADYGGPPSTGAVFESFCFGDDPMCTPDPAYGCSDVCGDNVFQTGGDFAANDLCQDGDVGSTGTKRCERGTDCTDCGPRTCADNNEPCSKNGDCCGFPDQAFCISDFGTCAATCSDARPCEGGETCTPLSGSDDSVCVL